jgi:hypothetical protein
VVARSFNTAQWRRLVQFQRVPQGQNILCLSYRGGLSHFLNRTPLTSP